MWDGFIGNQIRRATRNMLITNLCVLIGVCALAGYNAKYLNDWFRGPVAMAPERVAKASSPDDLDRNFVSFTVRTMIQTGYQEVTTNDAGKQTGVDAEFQLVPVGQRALIVRTEPGSIGTHLTGQLVAAPKQVFEGVRKQLPQEYQSSLMPFMLNTKGYRENGWWLLVICVPLLLLSLWNLVMCARYTSDFATHPIVKQLGGQEGIVACGPQLEAEMHGGGMAFGKARLTPSWVMVMQPFGMRIARLDNLAWCYKKVTKHSVYFIPTGKSFELVLWPTQASMFTAPAKEEQVDHLMAAIVERAPWVVAGFSAELERAWKKDRKGFIEAVEQRRNGSIEKTA